MVTKQLDGRFVTSRGSYRVRSSSKFTQESASSRACGALSEVRQLLQDSVVLSPVHLLRYRCLEAKAIELRFQENCVTWGHWDALVRDKVLSCLKNSQMNLEVPAATNGF